MGHSLSLILSFDTIMHQPYDITPTILKLVSSVSKKIGEVNAAHLSKPPTELRKKTVSRPSNLPLKLKEIR